MVDRLLCRRLMNVKIMPMEITTERGEREVKTILTTYL